MAKGCWREQSCGRGESKKERGRGGRRIFHQGTRVRNDPQGENEVESPTTEDAHTAARGELHIYF